MTSASPLAVECRRLTCRFGTRAALATDFAVLLAALVAAVLGASALLGRLAR